MKKFKLSTDILSPITSDISLNDSSVFSFGNTSDIPEFRREILSSKCESLDRDSSVDSFCKATLKESADAFDVIVNDMKKQSNINAEKEERFKESYKNLKHSMDELYNKVSHPSILSPVSSSISFENENMTEEMPKKTDTVSEIQKYLKKDCGKNESTKFKTVSQVSSRKSKSKEESKLRKKDNNQQSKNVLLKESTENTKHRKNKAYQQNEIGVSENNLVCGLQKPKTSKLISSSTQTCEYFEVEGAKRKENLKYFYTQKQRKPEISNSVPVTENKNLSIEASIQLAISMEMDNLRRFMLENNLCIRKDLLKLEETVKKQKEVTGYLFSVIQDLMEENMKLISYRKKM